MTSDQQSYNLVTSNLIFIKSENSQQYPVTFFSRKMITAQTRYKTHIRKLSAIIKPFKSWHYYLKGYKYKIRVLTNHNNLCRFIDTKNLSSRLICWAQGLSQYQFQIDYVQSKAKTAANTLSCFPQRSQAKEKILRDKNTQIFYCLQILLLKASIAKINLSSLFRLEETTLLPLYQIFICGTYILPRLCQF